MTACQVYPRVCGGTLAFSVCHSSHVGLSPRVRGNQVDAVRRASYLRSIPACAGEPLSRRATAGLPGVYPRVCGGTRRDVRSYGPSGGLSPRVRGNLDALNNTIKKRRSIPACAGEPQVIASCTVLTKVYPRVCGGTMDAIEARSIKLGLSPRVRGNRLPSRAVIPYGGSIPACAGEPTPLLNSRRWVAVYPRVCGGTTELLSIA